MLSRQFRFSVVCFSLLVLLVSGAKKRKKDEGGGDCNEEEQCCNPKIPAYNENTLFAGIGIWVLLFICSYWLLVKMSGITESKLWSLVFCKKDQIDKNYEGLVVPWGIVVTASLMIATSVVHIYLYGVAFNPADDLAGALWSDIILISFGLFFILRSFTSFPAQGWVDFIFEVCLIGVAMTVCAALFIDVSYSGWAAGGDTGAAGAILANSNELFLAQNLSDGDVSSQGLLEICKQYDFTTCENSTTGFCDGCLVYELDTSTGLCDSTYTGLCFHTTRSSATCANAFTVLQNHLAGSAVISFISYLLLMLAIAQWKIQQSLRPIMTPRLCCDPEKKKQVADEQYDKVPEVTLVQA